MDLSTNTVSTTPQQQSTDQTIAALQEMAKMSAQLSTASSAFQMQTKQHDTMSQAASTIRQGSQIR